MEEKLKAFEKWIDGLESSVILAIEDRKQMNNFRDAADYSARLHGLRDIKYRFQQEFKEDLK